MIVMFCYPTAPIDYIALPESNLTLDSIETSVHGYINITDDIFIETDERFLVTLTSLNEKCVVATSAVPVYIIDDDGTFFLVSYTIPNLEGNSINAAFMCVLQLWRLA